MVPELSILIIIYYVYPTHIIKNKHSLKYNTNSSQNCDSYIYIAYSIF